MTRESIFIDMGNNIVLNLEHIWSESSSKPAFLLHGAIENARIYYSESFKGLAPFLAQNGYHVYIADLRGKGKSTPAITKNSPYTQTENITEDIPAFINKINELHPNQKQLWIAHSWGGVLMNCVLSRFPEYLACVEKMIYFASKRAIHGFTLKKFLFIYLGWNRLAFLATKRHGYLPPKFMGSEKETVMTHKQSIAWVKPGKWIDTLDGFDYGEAIKKIKLPPTLFLTGAADSFLGAKIDVDIFRKESQQDDQPFFILGEKTGFLHDYGHNDIITHRDAPEDYFDRLLGWVEGQRF